MTRARVLTNLVPDSSSERIVQLEVIAQYHEKNNSNVVHPWLTDRDRFDDLLERFDLAIDLGRSDTHPTGIERGVGSTRDDETTSLGFFREVTVAPNPRKSLEIGAAIT